MGHEAKGQVMPARRRCSVEERAFAARAGTVLSDPVRSAPDMTTGKPRAVAFFGTQPERRIGAHDYPLNPFEERALPYLRGNVLDLGCGLGNLAFAAAARGAHVTAYDACEVAVEDLADRAIASGLDLWVKTVDLKGWRPEETYDAVNCIGLLMLFAREDARAGLAAVRDAVRPGGVAVVNAMIEGSTFLAMFDPEAYCLFAPDEIAAPFAGWEILLDSVEEFPAPGDKMKRFRTLIARRPA
jgi:tellurite methyltransferase